jgi:hypothetical protein
LVAGPDGLDPPLLTFPEPAAVPPLLEVPPVELDVEELPFAVAAPAPVAEPPVPLVEPAVPELELELSAPVTGLPLEPVPLVADPAVPLPAVPDVPPLAPLDAPVPLAEPAAPEPSPMPVEAPEDGEPDALDPVVAPPLGAPAPLAELPLELELPVPVNVDPNPANVDPNPVLVAPGVRGELVEPPDGAVGVAYTDDGTVMLIPSTLAAATRWLPTPASAPPRPAPADAGVLARAPVADAETWFAALEAEVASPAYDEEL